jgi:hypothetical protein
MRTISSAAMLAAVLLTATPAQAAEFTSPPVPLDPTSELLIAVVNTCTTAADYNIAIRNAVTGAVVRQKQGTIAAQRGTTLPFSFGVEREFMMVYHKITWGCRSTAQPRPLMSYTVRDRETKVPRFVGTSMDGNDI